MRESNPNKGHELQGNNIVDSSQVLFLSWHIHATELIFLFCFQLFYFIFSPWPIEEHESGWVGTWHQPRSAHHRGSAACWLKRCSFQTQTWLGFRLALSNVWYPAYSDSLTWLNFQWGICIGSCVIHNLLKLETLEHKWLTWSPL